MKRSNEQGSWFPRPFMRNKVGRYCNRPLMKIDRYGEVLIGCIDCNRWGHPGGTDRATTPTIKKGVRPTYRTPKRVFFSRVPGGKYPHFKQPHPFG
jgi:hypothetical protein